MNDLFYACFCEKRFDRKRKLILNGNDLFPRIGSVQFFEIKYCMGENYLIGIFIYRRRFQDSDMQSLLDFLAKNGDVASLSLAYNEIHCNSFTKLVDYLKVRLKLFKS